MPEPQHAGDYNIVKFLVHSHVRKSPINIAMHVGEIEIFEKKYLK